MTENTDSGKKVTITLRTNDTLSLPFISNLELLKCEEIHTTIGKFTNMYVEEEINMKCGSSLQLKCQ